MVHLPPHLEVLEIILARPALCAQSSRPTHVAERRLLAPAFRGHLQPLSAREVRSYKPSRTWEQQTRQEEVEEERRGRRDTCSSFS
eukprot:756307-Hanusia_phi.AAC.10